MNISPFILTSYLPKIHNNKCNQQNYRFNLKHDCVTFSGKKPQFEYSDIEKQGIAVGKEILNLERINNLSYNTLYEFLNKKSPVPIQIDKIQNAPSAVHMGTGKVIAHMMPLYNGDFSLAAANIYLGNLPMTSKEGIDFAANTAHEYTHILQRAKDKNYYGILKYTDDPTEVTLIARASQFILKNMCKMCQEKLFSNKKEAEKLLHSIIDGKIDIKKALGEMDFESFADIAPSMFAQQLNKNESDMKDAITGWIIQESQNEKEAYSVTLDILNRSKCDPMVKASRILSREIYSYINDYFNKKA